MQPIRKKDTDEFKQEAASLVLEHGYSYSEASPARSLDINPALLTKWCKRLGNEGIVWKKSDNAPEASGTGGGKSCLRMER